ncbi:MAG TPA: hypothetical protein VF660_11565 [Actinomycetota bacterium]
MEVIPAGDQIEAQPLGLNGVLDRIGPAADGRNDGRAEPDD